MSETAVVRSKAPTDQELLARVDRCLAILREAKEPEKKPEEAS